ncbi:MAG TPA: pseudouridine synthase [Thiothrix sp.]|nr:pseudouridine synthase [Thiothrix sp.]
MEEERIQKILARAGYGSRRKIEVWIREGKILVNGVPAILGQKITETADIQLDGQRLRLASRLKATPRVLLYHKKMGEVCSRDDPEGRDTVFKELPPIKPGRWISVGRLDINTDGLLLFTNDGELANKMMHPSSELEREYAVRVLGAVTDEMLDNLRKGVMLEDGKASFTNIVFAGGGGANSWFHVTLKEGRNREVRRLWESQDVKVSRLRRIRYGSIKLERRLRPGKYEDLPVRQTRNLYKSLGLEVDESLLPQREVQKRNTLYGQNKSTKYQQKKSTVWGKRSKRK